MRRRTVGSLPGGLFEGGTAAGQLLPAAATGTAVLLGHTFANGYTLDYLSVFWIGMALLSVLCALSVWRARPRQ